MSAPATCLTRCLVGGVAPTSRAQHTHRQGNPSMLAAPRPVAATVAEARHATGKRHLLPTELYAVKADYAEPEIQKDSTKTLVDLKLDDADREFAVAMAKVAWETKAEDLTVLYVEPHCSWTRFVVVLSVFSRPQLNACIVKMAKEAAATYDREPSANSGKSAWEVMDFGNVVVHLFSAELREFYNLEDFYATSEEVELAFEEEAAQSAEERSGWSTKM